MADEPNQLWRDHILQTMWLTYKRYVIAFFVVRFIHIAILPRDASMKLSRWWYRARIDEIRWIPELNLSLSHYYPCSQSGEGLADDMASYYTVSNNFHMYLTLNNLKLRLTPMPVSLFIAFNRLNSGFHTQSTIIDIM